MKRTARTQENDGISCFDMTKIWKGKWVILLQKQMPVKRGHLLTFSKLQQNCRILTLIF